MNKIYNVLNENGEVINTIVWDGVTPCGIALEFLQIAIEIEDTTKYVPVVLSRFQVLTVLKLTKLNETTTLYQATDDYIKSLDGDTTKEIVIQTAWETASEFRRDSILINTCKEIFNLTDKQVDEMFIKGAEIIA